MAADKLHAALTGVDWAGNVSSFLADAEAVDKFASINVRLGIWSKQLEQADKGNPALSFIREMQSSGQMAVGLTSLALYKPAASAIRAMIETALYYTYFRVHPAELETLIRDESFYLSKSEILDYHKQHTRSFKSFQEKLGLIVRLEAVYSTLSAIVHGQVPGVWSATASFKGTVQNIKTQNEVLTRFVEGEEVVHRLFLCTVAPRMWDDFSSSAKKPILKGLHGDLKALLKLDER